MARQPPDDYREALRKRGFDLGEWIGGGAYGNVYKANQGRLDRPVAVKFFDVRFTRGQANQKRFEREARLLARVQHPSIPYVITCGVIRREEDVPFTVMQFISGRSLEKRISAGTQMDVQEVFPIMRDVLSALQGAHGLGVVHRDVKPDNILLSTGASYLIDFSIGFCVQHESGLSRATGTGEGLGTPKYAAPEQLKDAASTDHRADIFSAGVVLGEMLGARVPIQLDRLPNEIPATSADLRSVVARACATDRDRRYQRADDFLAALDAAIGPRAVGLYDSQMVICPNLKCSGVTLSAGGNGYIFGPKITGPTTDPFCGNCGEKYLRGCPSCRLPLPENVGSLIAKQAKSETDMFEAHCTRCGETLFITPSCKKCGSYLKAKDIEADTSEGCEKCKPTGGGYGGYGRPSGSDDEIPF